MSKKQLYSCKFTDLFFRFIKHWNVTPNSIVEYAFSGLRSVKIDKRLNCSATDQLIFKD